MAWQLIYTSAPRGLAPGHSGFCTVARSADLRDAVAQRLEQISSYHYLDPAKVSDPARNPALHAYRILDLRGAKFHVLSRIKPAGLDFTARTNHLAHHLLFAPEELAALPSPATLLLHWPGWLNAWEGDPRLLDAPAPEGFQKLPGPAWPARAWLEQTGDAGRAAGLLETEYARGCYLLCPPASAPGLLELFRETLQLLNPDGLTPQRPWQTTFTTFLQAADAPADFHWRGCLMDSPAAEQVQRRTGTFVQIPAIRVPDNALARLARDGPAQGGSSGDGTGPAPSARTRPLVTHLGALTSADFARNVSSGAAPHPAPALAFGRLPRKTVVAIGIALLVLLGLVLIKYFWLTGGPPPPPVKTIGWVRPCFTAI